MKHLLLLVMIGFFTSCSTMNIHSGKYIELKKNDTIKSISKRFNAPVWQLRELNPNKNFVAGQWVRIPVPSGIIGTAGRAPATYTPGVYDQLFSAAGYKWPVPDSSQISSDYGHRWGRDHNGIDIPGRVGTPIIAANDGVVVYSGDEYTGFGNVIIIAHRDGYFTIYGHNNKNYVSKGQYVRKGESIGQVGNTGRSTGAHLHFEVRKNGDPINPHRLVARN